MVTFDDQQIEVEKLSDITELSGKLSKGEIGDKLMNSVVENDKKAVNDGKLIREGITPSLILNLLDISKYL